MNISQPEKKLMKRRIFTMFIGAALVLGAATGGWFWLANQVDERFERRVERLAAQGKVLECNNQRVEGYPFRIGLYCDDIAYRDEASNVSFRAGEVRSAAQFYQPGFVIGEMDGPAVLKWSNLGDMILDWKLVRSSSKVTTDGIKRISLKLEDFSALWAEDNQGKLPQTGLSFLELHLRPANGEVGSPDIDLAIDARELRIENVLGTSLPPLQLKADGVVSQLSEVLKRGDELGSWIRANGLDLEFRSFEIGLKEGGSFAASGPLQVDRSGLVSGTLNVELSGIDQLADKLVETFPQMRQNMERVRQTLAIFAQSSGDGKVRMQLQIRRGSIMAGFIPLGYIPRLF